MENKKNQIIGSGAIIAVLIIVGAVLLHGKKPVSPITPNQPAPANQMPLENQVPANNNQSDVKIGTKEHTLGNANAPITVIEYADYQCPFCGAITGLQTDTPVIDYMKKMSATWTPFMPGLIKDYVETGKVFFVFRSYPFLGPESSRATEATECANDQGKYWNYHNYLFAHQNGENEGAFADENLKSFAKILGLNTDKFNSCLETGKYAQAVKDFVTEAKNLGIDKTGTPIGLILKNGKIIDTISGAESYDSVQPKLDEALK